ncbi:monooxygenase [Streptomyces olivaceus]|nr:monooxygenase [Streptomyces olivaceus]MBZ6164492.1 monooxygenase [Streptomyces olivaceus]
MMGPMHIRIDAVDLPGLVCPVPVGGRVSEYRNVHVAVQRRDRPGELLAPQPGDARSASWTLECTTSVSPDGIEVQGPYVQDRLGHRFVYLSWGTVDDAGTFTMFRRAKLMLDAVPADVLAAARDGLLVGRLGLTDAQGGPLCARVRPPDITWTAERAGQGDTPR